jgi:outer membrane protein OmpA-like peptidoglycan-associated protein
MKRFMAICLLLASCSGEQLKAFHDGQSNQKAIVHFEFNAWHLNAGAKEQLDSLVLLITGNSKPVTKIEISGYCDSVGSKSYNDELSVKRALQVKLYLHEKGVGDSLIVAVNGFGKSHLLSDNQDENRRVEILLSLNLVPKSDSKKGRNAIADTSGLKAIDVSHARVNDIIQLPDINFFPDRHLIVDASRSALTILLNTMKLNPTLRIEIRGHVCCLPSYQGDSFDEDTYTEDLSVQRAKEIYLYLSENGISKERMTYIGLGAKYPLVKEFTDQDKAKNRRVEIKILGK